MQAWQYIADHQPPTLNDIEEPVARPDEVLIDVKAAGMCHTDIGYLDGTVSDLLGHRPITLGHEIAGIIKTIGNDVTDFAVGDRVAVRSTVEGPGTGRDGGFQPVIATRTDALVKVPDGVSWDQAAVSTDAATTSFHAVAVEAHAAPGMKLGIIGFGGLGSLAAQIALLLGAHVYVAEARTDAYPAILNAGATAVSAAISDFTDVSLDAIIDFAGTGETTAAAILAVRPGGTVVRIGLADRFGTLDLVTLTMNRVTVIGSNGGTNADNSEVLRLMAEGSLRSDTEIIDFASIGDGIGRMRKHQNRGRLTAVYK